MDRPCSSFVAGYISTFGAASVWIASHINPTAQKSCKVTIFILNCDSTVVHSLKIPNITDMILNYFHPYCK